MAWGLTNHGMGFNTPLRAMCDMSLSSAPQTGDVLLCNIQNVTLSHRLGVLHGGREAGFPNFNLGHLLTSPTTATTSRNFLLGSSSYDASYHPFKP
jgi:hypothetical protein